ncbi:glycosyltransferase family 4 protein [Enemella sp. A6]|uniref:glycosyltransferase family 4 protein n=1 Tax=Enemella sp. A6 TaxID=3440152 RepID=UPI003EBE7ADA
MTGPRNKERGMRIALLSYRTKEHSGGQGVYIRQLSTGLVELGHRVEVFSGQPYPENLDERVTVTRVPSLDLYREPDPFRIPKLSEYRDLIDVQEYALTGLTGAFAEPLTFSKRIARIMRRRASEFDIVHDNQSLGTGLLELVDHGVPLAATIHHPITRDRRVELAAAPWWKKPSVARWYSFVSMQAKVARRIPILIGVSRVSVDDTINDFGLRPEQFRVVPLGADISVFHPDAAPRRVSGRIVCVASADNPLKGVDHLLDAVAKLRVERDVELQLVCKLNPQGATQRRIDELGIADIVHASNGLSDAELASLLASAEVVAVPSLYEGFSLPTVEALACGTPVVASNAGALPEVLGTDGTQGLLVPPGDAEALVQGIGALLDDPQRRARMGAAARERAVRTFSWTAVAARTVEAYADAQEAAARHRSALRAADNHRKGAHADR